MKYYRKILENISIVFENKHAKISFLYLSSNIFGKLIAFISIPIFTRILSVSEYGIVTTYISWTSILTIIIGLSLGNTVRSAYIDFKDDYANYISSVLILSTVISIIVSLITLFIFYFLFPEVNILFIIIALIHSFSNYIILMFDIKFMLNYEYIKRIVLMVVPPILIMILSLVLLNTITYDKPLLRIIGYSLPLTVIALLLFIRNFNFKDNKFVFKYWKYAITLAIPLVFHGLSMNVLAFSDRTLILLYRGSNEAGLYGAAYSLGMLIIPIVLALESAWIPWFNDNVLKKEFQKVNKYAKLYVFVITLFVMVFVLLGPDIFSIVFPKTYESASFILPIIVASGYVIFLYSLYVNMEYLYKANKYIALNTMFAALINLLLNFLLIPKYGYVIASTTTLIAYLSSLILHYKVSRKLNCNILSIKLFLFPIFIIVIATITTMIFDNNFTIRIMILMIMLLLFVFIFNKERKNYESE
jgi:O-antigen/teichoic acid export membrane protein